MRLGALEKGVRVLQLESREAADGVSMAKSQTAAAVNQIDASMFELGRQLRELQAAQRSAPFSLQTLAEDEPPTCASRPAEPATPARDATTRPLGSSTAIGLSGALDALGAGTGASPQLSALGRRLASP